ncbi:MAG: enoyl-CoA hydratase/isomerase family protein [Paraburkholderia sp.]|jgi:enoyl-CoA hydratase|nr:enoyl-CoA hydratase/isomerase family protein [Paraburkholderia sp.]
MNYTTIKAAKEEGIGFLTFSRPQIHNAISVELMVETMDALDRLARDDAVRVIVVSGEGKSFCSGFDLKQSVQRATKGVSGWRTRYEQNFEFMLSFWDCPKPTIASIHGHCLAGGFELSLACDISIAAQSARFGMPEAKFGSSSVLLMLPWLAGPKMAKEILMCGLEGFDAHLAREARIVNHVVPDAQREAFTRELALQIVSSSPYSVSYFKKVINQTFDAMGMRTALRAALDAGIMVEADENPETIEFSRIRKESGLKAAIEWRKSRSTVVAS